VDTTIRAFSISALPTGRSASTSDHITFNKGRPVHTGWKTEGVTASIDDISKTNKPVAPCRNQTPTQSRQICCPLQVPYPRSSNKPAALSRNQTPSQGRQTNLLHSPGTKPLPKFVKQTRCPLQKPNPFPRSSNKPAALSRNQTPSQGRQTNHGAQSFLRSHPVNFAASQEIPRIYGTRKFFTIPTSDRHLSLS
jgi:hypothetical protein